MKPSIVLTSDRCLMSNYDPLCLGAAADLPVGTIPRYIMFRFVLPRLPEDDEGRVIFAPYCIRKVESILAEKFGKDVIVVNPDKLGKVVNEHTKIVAVSTIDPLSIGPPVTTFCELLRGYSGPITYISEEFRRLMFKLRRLKTRYRFKVVVGGPGAWELADSKLVREYSIDHLLIGEAEEDLVEVFTKIIEGQDVPEIVKMRTSVNTRFRPILNPSICGLVEITRGCGRGCMFCSPTTRPFRSVPLDVIAREVKINLKYWKTIHLVTEDFLRYGSNSFQVNKNSILKLIYMLKMLGVDNISPIHTTFATVVQAPDIIHEIREVFEVDVDRGRYIGTQIGLETGSSRLIEKYMRGKAKPYTPDKWCNIVEDACNILHENGWIPVVTLILGLPDETDDDVYKTIELMDKLKDLNLVWVPCLFTSLRISQLKEHEPLRRDTMRRCHWELIAECCKLNIKIIEKFVNNYFKISKKGPIRRFLYSRAFNLMRKIFLEVYNEVMRGEVPPPIIVNFSRENF
ncbi:MAG: B12-binding domain-containing radical SAM protein [Crenarchaeota archaeon]|nr:B12-binding domain-containing radical SAM protein [Thermoproteota archaeon]